MSKLAELVRDAGPPISRLPQRLHETPVTLEPPLRFELEVLLHLRNGFRCLDGALVVRPSLTVGGVRGIESWNELTLWRRPYRHASEILFFADTIIGHLFGLFRDAVVAFDPETGRIRREAGSLEAWAASVLEAPESCGRAALDAIGTRRLDIAERLQPLQPLRFGGTLADVIICNDLELMRRYASLYVHCGKAPAESDEIPPLPPDWLGGDS